MIGGITVDTESLKNKDTLQMQQMIIFLKSEIVKYQNEISSLKNSDDYSMVVSLEQENEQLANQKKELSMELMKSRKVHEKEMNALHEEIQSRENQRIKLISSIDALVKSKNELQEENKMLKKAIEEAHTELTPPKIHWPEDIIKDYVKSIENMENTLRDFIQKNNQQLSIIIEELIKNRSEAIDINLYLLKEIKTKSDKIDMLMNEIDKLKGQHYAKLLSSSNDKTEINSDTAPHLDNQVQNMFTQATNFEAQIDEKLRILDDLECKLIQLANQVSKQRIDNQKE